MQEFKYQVKGTADESPNGGVIKAPNEAKAMESLSELYGPGIDIKIINDEEFSKIEKKKGQDLIHRPKDVG